MTKIWDEDKKNQIRELLAAIIRYHTQNSRNNFDDRQRSSCEWIINREHLWSWHVGQGCSMVNTSFPPFYRPNLSRHIPSITIIDRLCGGHEQINFSYWLSYQKKKLLCVVFYHFRICTIVHHEKIYEKQHLKTGPGEWQCLMKSFNCIPRILQTHQKKEHRATESHTRETLNYTWRS